MGGSVREGLGNEAGAPTHWEPESSPQVWVGSTLTLDPAFVLPFSLCLYLSFQLAPPGAIFSSSLFGCLSSLVALIGPFSAGKIFPFLSCYPPPLPMEPESKS